MSGSPAQVVEQLALHTLNEARQRRACGWIELLESGINLRRLEMAQMTFEEEYAQAGSLGGWVLDERAELFDKGG